MEFRGKEICVAYSENEVAIVDVTDKTSPTLISSVSNPGHRYTHQGWLDEQQEFAFVNDEMDEAYSNDKHTKTLLFNLQTLANPTYVGVHKSDVRAIDHNNYVRGDRVYQANYCAGLRVLKIKDRSPTLEEVGYFDVEPNCNTATFAGSWSVFPYYPSGTLVVSSIERGLFVLEDQTGPS